MSQIINLAFFRAKPTQSEALGVALLNLVEPTRNEEGCIQYKLHRSHEDADVWLVYENWLSSKGLAAHMTSPHVLAFLKTAPDLLLGDIDLRQFDTV